MAYCKLILLSSDSESPTFLLSYSSARTQDWERPLMLWISFNVTAFHTCAESQDTLKIHQYISSVILHTIVTSWKYLDTAKWWSVEVFLTAHHSTDHSIMSFLCTWGEGLNTSGSNDFRPHPPARKPLPPVFLGAMIWDTSQYQHCTRSPDQWQDTMSDWKQ